MIYSVGGSRGSGGGGGWGGGGGGGGGGVTVPHPKATRHWLTQSYQKFHYHFIHTNAPQK